MSVFIDLIGELLGRGHSVRCRVNGWSMYPTFKDGEKIVVEPVAPSSIDVGDILVYRSHDRVIAHRVVRLAKTAQPLLLLRGDASESSCEEPVEASQVLGRVTCVQRDGSSIDLERRLPKRVSALRFCAARLRRAVSRRLPRVTSLLRTGRILYSGYR